MPRAWLRIKNEGGFSPVEVLLAATIFGFLTTALIGAIVYGRSSTASAGERVRAQALAEEGVEAVRNVRDAAYTNIPDGTYGIAQSGNVWVLSGSSDVTGIFTRQITITTVDSVRKNIVATVSWPQGSATAQAVVTSRLTNWSATIPPTFTPGPIMMAYSKTTATPSYRIWNGTAWGTEASGQNVSGNINYVVLKSARTRNETILGTQDSTGAINIQIWNGTSWSSPTLVGQGNATTRAFDIAYEKNSDQALIAFIPSVNSPDFSYRTWNGTTLSSAIPITSSPTTGALNWLELRQNPLSTSDEIAMLLLDANADVYGMAWTGSSWSNMGGLAVAWDTTAASGTKKAIDIEYEQNTGEAMFLWGDSVATDQYYRTWNGTSLGTITLLDIPAQGGIAEWVQLAARPGSNEIMLGVQDAGSDFNTRKWSGTAWDTATQHPEHAATVENITSRTFDIVWETHSSNLGKAWVMWGNGTTVNTRQWSGTAWGTTSALASSDDTSFIRLRADPSSGAVFATLYEDSTSATDDIWETRLTGGSATWTAKNIIWGGPTGTTPVFFRVDISTP